MKAIYLKSQKRKITKEETTLFFKLSFCFILFLPLSFSAQTTKEIKTSQTDQIEFIENLGQLIDENQNRRNDLLFVSDGGNAKIYMQKNKISYLYTEQIKLAENHSFEIEKKNLPFDQPIKGYRIDVAFLGANTNTSIQKNNPMPGYYNYYLPSCPNGLHNVQSYTSLKYCEMYKNIDIYFSGQKDKGLKYDIVVKPGGDVNAVKIKYSGHDNLELRHNRLSIKTSLGYLEEHLPRVYQKIDGKIIDVSCEYKLHNDEIKFNVGRYNKNHDLIIDPWVTYYGGTDYDLTRGLATDAVGNIFVSGFTGSSNFPLTAGAFQTNSGGLGDAFVLKLDKDGNRLWCTYYGGADTDVSYGIATDPIGNIVLTGGTSSTNFPVSAGAFQSSFGGGGGSVFDAFLLKFDTNGNRLWGTYYGGNVNDQGTGITTNSLGDILVSGYTASTNFPTSIAALQVSYGGGINDGFILKFDASGNRLWATYFGGSGDDLLYSVCRDALDNIIVVGSTKSTNLGVTGGAFQTTIGGIQNAFILKLSPTGGSVWCTYFGGNYYDEAKKVTVDAFDNVLVTGRTASNNFPVTAGAFQTTFVNFFGGITDAFVLKLTSSGNRLWATYLGGDNIEEGLGIAIDSKNNVYASGDTYSANFPVTSCAFQQTLKGNEDGYLAKFDPNGTRICSGFLGGTSGQDDEEFIIVIYNDMVYMAGDSPGPFPVTAGAYQTTHAGGYDAVVAALCGNTCGFNILTVSMSANATTICNADKVNYSSTISSCDTSDTNYNWFFPGGTPSTSTTRNPTNIQYNTAGIFAVKLVITSSCGKDSIINNNYIIVNSCGSVLSSSMSSVDVLCNGASSGSATVNVLNGTPNYTYIWSNGTSSNTSAISNTLTNLSSGLYTVTVVDAAGTTTTNTFSITEPPVITPGTITPTTASCGQNNGGAVTAIATGGTGALTYSWSNGNSGLTATNLSAQTYTLTVKDANNCTTTSTVNIGNTGGVSISTLTKTDVLCNGGTGNATVNITGGASGNYTYSWSNGANTITTATSNQEQLTSNTYTVTVNDGSCTVTSVVTITQPSVITLSNPVVTNASCNQSNGAITLATPTGGTTPYTYSWSNGASTQNISLIVANGYTVTVKDNNGCSITTAATVTNTNGTSILAATGINPLCNSGTGSATVTITASTAPYTYSWSNGTSSITTATSNQEQLTSNSYTVTVTDANNCSTTTTVQINQPATLSISTPITTDASCNQNNGSISITASGGTTPYTYSWSNGASTITTGTSNLALLSSNTYIVTVSDNNNCSTTTSTTIVNINSSVNAAVTTNITSNTISEGESIVLSAGGGTSYTWTPNNTLSCATCPVTIANPTATTTYTLIAKDNLGCADTTDITINVKKPCTGEEDVFIANVFSPNNDGKNDVLQIQGNGLTNIYFAIYDRWGNLMFETRDQAQGWDGNVNGNTANAGTYVYYLKATCKKTLQEIILKGNVSVVK